MRVLGAITGAVVLAAWPAGAELAPERQARLRDMVAQDCGSCHGMTRQGGLGSPLLQDDMVKLSAESVVHTILEGRPGTPMPPWKTMLSRDDAAWIAAYLMGEVK
ncbi:Cytochrome c55X precursor NirC [Paramagnetospirillum magnetotacticum MS-1]|uniref:Cytochrome c55X NirC n=1 Tax=Paramagnetospirillum magnetotacticum MS-1 TaxID=272627 RepID=A0A0C2UEP5_PARME|nr:cytochrome c [Paramagnetospirillum magnetotacticum]KIL99972.1 Cytochrome c55X precursor NirC [Paramagnetospirillum magnetotacticum MS-1]